MIYENRSWVNPRNCVYYIEIDKRERKVYEAARILSRLTASAAARALLLQEFEIMSVFRLNWRSQRLISVCVMRVSATTFRLLSAVPSAVHRISSKPLPLAQMHAISQQLHFLHLAVIFAAPVKPANATGALQPSVLNWSNV